MSVRLLSKMTAKNASIDSMGISGELKITSYDVAVALSYGTLSEYAYYLGRAKYCHDETAHTVLWEHLEERIQQAIKKNNWKDSEGRAKGMALLVLNEGVYRLPCTHCHGRGIIWKKSKGNGSINNGKQCAKCNGTGLGRLSERQRAKIANVPISSWTRTWASYHHKFICYVTGLESELISHMHRQFSDNKQLRS